MTATTTRKTDHYVVRISKSIDQALSSAAKDFGITRASIVRQALLEYLERMADSKALAEARQKGGKMITHAELKAQLGLSMSTTLQTLPEVGKTYCCSTVPGFLVYVVRVEGSPDDFLVHILDKSPGGEDEEIVMRKPEWEYGDFKHALDPPSRQVT